MTTVSDRVLRQYLAGALDPPDHEALERALTADPALRDRLAVLLATTPAVPRRPDAWTPWTLPPPGVHAGLRGAAGPAAVMDGTTTADWLVVRLDVPDGHDRDLVVVLERSGEHWTVVFPRSADEAVQVARLPREDGQVRLDLQSGGHRMAVVLVPQDWVVDWSLPEDARWERVRGAVGELPVFTVLVG